MKLSQEQIEGMRTDPDNIKWRGFCYHYVLSEEVIREFQDRVDWADISWRQTLSENFMREFQDKIHWENLSWYKNLSKEFCFEFYEKIYWRILDVREILYKGYFDNAPKHVKLYIALNYRELNKYL